MDRMDGSEPDTPGLIPRLTMSFSEVDADTIEVRVESDRRNFEFEVHSRR